jgi:hypothetical protein
MSEAQSEPAGSGDRSTDRRTDTPGPGETPTDRPRVGEVAAERSEPAHRAGQGGQGDRAGQGGQGDRAGQGDRGEAAGRAEVPTDQLPATTLAAASAGRAEAAEPAPSAQQPAVQRPAVQPVSSGQPSMAEPGDAARPSSAEPLRSAQPSPAEPGEATGGPAEPLLSGPPSPAEPGEAVQSFPVGPNGPDEQPVMPMRVLDGSLPAARPRHRRPPARSAAGVLAGAGILTILGAVTPLVQQLVTVPDGRLLILRITAAGTSVSTGTSFVVGNEQPHWDYPLIGAGVLAVLVALALNSGSARLHWARPLATAVCGLVLGMLVMLGVDVKQALFLADVSEEFHIQTDLGPGTWLSVAALLLAVAGIVLTVRLSEERPAVAPEADLDTPPLGLPVLGQPAPHDPGPTS